MINLAARNNFRLDIPNDNTGTFQWQIQTVNIPSVSMEIASITRGPAKSKLAGNHVAGSGTTFEDLTITFLVDENLNAYSELLEWLLTMNNPLGASSPEGKTPKTILLHILDNNKDKILNTVRFLEAFPKTLGEVEWNYTETGDVDSITCDVTFEYSYFEFIRKVDGTEQVIRPYD